MRPRLLLACYVSFFGLLVAPVESQECGVVSVDAHILQPRGIEPTEELLGELEVPSGFRLETFAANLGHARMLAAGPDGAVYVTRPKTGDVLRLHDRDGNGRVDESERVTVAEKPNAHGIAIHENTLYLATIHEVYAADLQDDGTLGELRTLVRGLPDGGQHPNRTVGVGPDGRLYVSIGSLSNAADSPADERTASILRARTDGSELSVFARGLRNTIGFGWHPETAEMWGMDHGIDWLGDDRPPEELNRLVEGAHYGWPHLWGDGNRTPMAEPPPPDLRQKLEAPVLEYTAHSAPLQMAFYRGDRFPEEYRDDAFVAMRGSWNRLPPSGYEIVRIDFVDGEPKSIEPFVTGFLRKQDDGSFAHLGRLAGLAISSDGSVLVSDDANGIVYRIVYGGS